MVRVDVGGVAPEQVTEGRELGAAFALDGTAGDLEVQPDRKGGMPRCDRLARPPRKVRRTIKLALVTMPRSCASTMPSLTPADIPRSSAFTTRIFAISPVVRI